VVLAWHTPLVVDVGLLVVSAALVGVTYWYAWLTKRIAESSEVASRVASDAARSAARSAAAAEAALLADSMPFVRPSFGGGGQGAGHVDMTMSVSNSGRHAALNVELFIGEDLLARFAVVGPGESSSHKWQDSAVAKRLWEARARGWVLRTRYSDPYGNWYEVEVTRQVRGNVPVEISVATFQLDEDGQRSPLATRGA